MSGLLLSQAWVIFRQKGARTIETIAWVWLAMWWGNIVLAGYSLVAMLQSGGNQQLLLTGGQAGTLHPVWQPNIPARIFCTTAASAAGALMITGIAHAPTAIAAAGYVLALAPVVLGLSLLASAPMHRVAKPSAA